MINESNARRLAAYLRAQPAIDMNRFCGTTFCIAGHAEMLFHDEKFRCPTLKTALGLTNDQYKAVAWMADEKTWRRVLGDSYNEDEPLISTVTPDQAAEALLSICGIEERRR